MQQMRRALGPQHGTLQQLASLLELQLPRTLSSSLQQQRPFAGDSLQYAKDRKAFDSSLSELRKQWAKQRLAQAARKAAREKEERLRVEAARAQKAQQDAAAKEARMQQLLEKQAVERELRAQEKMERLKKHTLRQEVLQVSREERRRRLLAQSKNWITAETLDMRIKEAIDNPVSLFAGEQPAAAAAGPGGRM